MTLFSMTKAGALVLSMALACSIPADAATRKAGASAADSAVLSAHFQKVLKGDGVCFKGGSNLKKEDVQKARTLVWDAWRQANSTLEELRLPGMPPLGPEKCLGYWTIPENLEPHAILYYLWGTCGERPSEGYPSYMYLHGSGNPDGEFSNGLQICLNIGGPAAFFIPRIPNANSENGVSLYRWWQKGKQYVWERFFRQAFLNPDLDPLKLYFIGISEGAYGSQRLASFYADYLAGAGPIAGGEPLKNAPAENCANIAFSFRTGNDDLGFYRNILTGYTKEAFDSLALAHPGLYNHNIEIPEGADHHSIGYYKTVPWLKDFSRNPYPTFVDWEDFEMDGIHRDGFYNIYIPERTYDGRRRYEMNIEGNDISLKVSDVAYEVVQTDPMWGIQMKFRKSYSESRDGKVVIYLSDELVDLDKPVTLTVNGKKAYKGMVKRNMGNIVNSCSLFYDPCRLYTACIEVNIAEL